MSKKNKEKDLLGEKIKKNKKEKKSKNSGPGIRILTLSSIRDALLYGALEKRLVGELKIPYFTKTGIQKNLKYNDETKIRVTIHQKFVLHKVEDGKATAITPSTISTDNEDFVSYELNFEDFLKDIGNQVLWSTPIFTDIENRGEKPMNFYVIDSTSKAKEPQKYALVEKTQSIATLIKVEDDKRKDFCQIWFEI